jgi:hypothetical protein
MQAEKIPNSKKENDVLKKDLKEDEIIEILLDDRWPVIPFA